MKEKTDGRNLSKSAQFAIRERAVAAVLGGMKQVTAATAFGVTRRVISKWMRLYRSGGKKMLKVDRRGRPRGAAGMKGWQCALIVRLIKDRQPDQLKLPFYLWTREAVRDLIKERFGKSYSLAHVGRLLAKWGFTPQKPVNKAYEQCPDSVRRWIELDYPTIAARAREEKAEIQWADEMGVRSDAPGGQAYAPKGKTPSRQTPGRRFGCNMISSISNRGTLRFMVFGERFTTDVMLSFLKRLVKSMDRKVFLLVDGHPVHRSQKVREWLDQHADAITMFRMPPYSPELNPDEMLNNDVKANAVRRRRAKNHEDLIANIRGYLRSRQHKPELVKRYFHAKTVQYAAGE